MRCVISVLGKDRTGIVAAVSTALADKGASIDDINQSLLQDMFSMTMLVRLDESVADFNEVQDALTKVGEDLGVQIVIQREDLFQFMYKI
ncbi:MAG: ACT domain-containing protein [Coriobacteriia bacterium]|nr:ACT domain-containing protein [Coriobacteriia bacterium]